MKVQVKNFVPSFLFLLIILTASVIAQPRPKPPVDANFKHGKIINKLNLDESQKNQFYEITYGHRKKAIDLRAEIRKTKLEINKMMNTGNIDEDKILSLSDKIDDLQGKIMRSKLNTWFAVYKILKPEQQKIWISNFKKFVEMHRPGKFEHHRMGMRGKFGNFFKPKF